MADFIQALKWLKMGNNEVYRLTDANLILFSNGDQIYYRAKDQSQEDAVKGNCRSHILAPGWWTGSYEIYDKEQEQEQEDEDETNQDKLNRIKAILEETNE